MSSVARKIKAGTAALGLAGAAALVAPAGTATAQNGVWADGCSALGAFNPCDIVVNAMAMPLNMSMLTFSDPITEVATFTTGSLMMNAMGPNMAGVVDAVAIWLMGTDQEVTFGSGAGKPQMTFFLASYRGMGFSVSPSS